jgi:hypothetical protein
MALNTFTASNGSCPSHDFLQESLNRRGVGCHKDRLFFSAFSSNNFARLFSPGLVNGLDNLRAGLQRGNVASYFDTDFIEKSA